MLLKSTFGKQIPSITSLLRHLGIRHRDRSSPLNLFAQVMALCE
jgi:hypothetical protein